MGCATPGMWGGDKRIRKGMAMAGQKTEKRGAELRRNVHPVGLRRCAQLSLSLVCVRMCVVVRAY